MSVSVAGTRSRPSPQLRARGDPAGVKVHSASHFFFVSWSQSPWCKFPSGTPRCSSPVWHRQFLICLHSHCLVPARPVHSDHLNELGPSNDTRAEDRTPPEGTVQTHKWFHFRLNCTKLGLGLTGDYDGDDGSSGGDEKTTATTQWSWWGFKKHWKLLHPELTKCSKTGFLLTHPGNSQLRRLCP